MFKRPDPTAADPPVVLEEQAADNGPAALRALLLGFGIDVPLTDLRRRLAPTPAGASIDDLEAVANQLGLCAEQVILPAEHVTMSAPGRGPLPAVGIVADDFEGLQFLLIWRTDGDRVQVMHTTGGALWLSRDELESRLYRHDHPMATDRWLDYAAGNGFLSRVEQRVRELGATADQATALAQRAGAATWCGPAALDAATRWLESTGAGDLRTLEATFEALLEGRCESRATVPNEYWFVTPDRSNPGTVILHGAVIVSARRRRRRLWPWGR